VSFLDLIVGPNGAGKSTLFERVIEPARPGLPFVNADRIAADRFGADANSPVMDNIGGGPLGISELLFRATTVPTYLKGDWFRDWGALQRLAQFYPNATTARLQLGTATRSGLWSPAPLRPT
jgi:arabinosyltransferase C